MLKSGVVLIVLAGWSSVASAQWTGLTNAFPSGFASTCLLLTDGTVMCHEYNTNRWHRLNPDINGSYQNGSWDVPGFTVADMPNGNDPSFGCVNCTYRPLYFASAVLADGGVVVIGGEYNNLVFVKTNIGFLYDPVANSWSQQLTEAFGGGQIGDSSGIVLEDGTFLLAEGKPNALSMPGNVESLDLTTSPPSFTALNPTGKLAGASNNQENWNILYDGRILTVNSFVASSFEIYDPVANTWGNSGPTPVNLADTGPGTVNSKEVGPAVLRPDGTLIAFSGTNSGQNAVYNTATGTWAATGAAGDFPVGPGASHFAVADGPASLLPNGNVLVMASPVYPTDPPGVFNAPSHFFEFDGTNLTQVADSPNAASFISYQGRMLLLPSGEVLLTAYNQCPCGPTPAIADIQLYSNGGAPQNAWRPVITTAPSAIVAGNTFSISGRLFNGFSEGASYGDDAQSSTNYPLVRIRNHATGRVFYARTHNHSRMGVEAVGSAEIVTTQFDVPAGVEPGPSDLVVVVNGIPSLPANTVIFEFLQNASFVVGDLSESVGASVTFWGAQWARANALSGGEAPSSFKGYANNLSLLPPVCGITWTSSPGNSSHPPATVPSYMGVLVSSVVSRSGSTLSGNAVRIAVIQTDPGYLPNPGGTGTGTVVAEYCP